MKGRIIVIGKKALSAIVVAIVVSAATGQAMGAECRDGHPSFSLTSPPNANVFDGSPSGTRVYGIITTIRVSLGTNAQSLEGDASLSCDAKHIAIRVQGDGTTYVFPIDAMIQKVYMPGVSAVFSPLSPNPEMSRQIRDGSAILLKTL